MNVLILEPSDAYAGGFDPRKSHYQPLFKKANRSNVFPELPARALVEQIRHIDVYGAFDDAVRSSDVLIVVCSDSSFMLGALVMRALSVKTLVCALVPSHMIGSAIDRDVIALVSSSRYPITRDVFTHVGDGKQSRVDAIESLLSHCDNIVLAKSKKAA